MTEKPRILLVGDGGVETGYARILRSIFLPLRDEFEIVQLATRHPAGSGGDSPWRVVVAAETDDPYGFGALPGLINDIRPDVTFLLYDLAYQAAYVECVRAAGHATRLVIYSPVEGGPLEPEQLAHAGGTTYVLFTEVARQEVLAGLRRAEAYGVAAPGIDAVHVIPHGVDTGVFRPLPGTERERRSRARSALGLPDKPGTFLVLNANRNLLKKRLDLTLAGFARFARGKPASVKLLLHTETDGESGWNLPVLARRLGISDRVLFTGAGRTRTALSDEHLNLLYNACDLGLNTSTSEGWGLVSFEHAATRAAQLVPATPVLGEIWGAAAYALEPALTLPSHFDHTDTILIHPDTIARGLEAVYVSEELRTTLAEGGYQLTRDPAYTWENICDSWRGILRGLAAERA